MHVIEQFSRSGIRYRNLILAALATLGFMLVMVSPVNAQSEKLVCEQLGGTWVSKDGGTCSHDGNPEEEVSSTIEAVLNLLSIVVGVLSVVMLIVGGIKYVLSGGESAQTASAKNTIIYALVGIVIAATSQAIVIFVLDKL